MAENVKVGFQVTGDSADALAAIKQLADGVVKLATVLEKFNNSTATSSTKASTALAKVKDGLDKAAAAAQKLQTASAAIKPPDAGAVAAPAAGGAAPVPTGDGTAQGIQSVVQLAKQANSVKNQLVAIWPQVSSVASSAFIKIKAGLAKLGNVPALKNLGAKFAGVANAAKAEFAKISSSGVFSKISGAFAKVSVAGKAAFAKVGAAGSKFLGKFGGIFGSLAAGAYNVFKIIKTVGAGAFAGLKVAARVAGAGFTTVFTAMLGRAGLLRRAISLVGAALRSAFSGSIVGLLSSFSSGLDKLSKGFLNFVDVVRISAQGITNMGRTLFFFLTIPAMAFLKGLATAAIDFEDALIRVQKTTNLASGSTEQYEGTMLQLKDLLRDQARYSMRSHVELAQVAEVIGQMGVTSVPAIANLTQIFDMMSTTMGVAAEDVALSLGKIANAFQWNLNNSSEEVFKLGNVINYLENTTAASAAEIMTAMSKWAQAASLLGITAAEAAGLSAAMVSMGLTEEEAGTALKRLSSQLAANIDEITALMGANEKYADRQATLNAINEDAVSVFLDIAEAARAAREAGQRAESLEALISIADERGGRALAALASNVEFVRQVLDASNTEWERATSLMAEYNRAMTSTKANLAAVKNNINDAAITIGDALLPLIRQVTTVMIPAIQMFSNWFKNLSRRAQMTGLAIAGLVIIAGPLIMIFGQITHGIFLIFQGFGLLGKAIAFVVGNFAGFLKTAGVLSKAALAWPLAIAAAATIILKILSNMGVDVAGFFTKLAENASAWGRSLMETYGTGLASAANFVLKIISKIAGLIARFFEAHSPPAAGPLSTIDTWGSALLQTYLDGFKNADFSVLEEVGGIIEHILTRGVEDDNLPDVLKKYAKARVKLAQLIEQFNATGIIDEALLAEATDGLGSIADEVQELIRLQMRYNQLQQELADLESQRKDVLKTYDAEIAAIAASNMSVEEKVAAIRDSQSIRDDSLRAIEEEKRATEDEADALKVQLEYQEKMIDAMNTQDDLLQRIADALERMSGSGGDAGGAGEGFAFGEIDTTDFDSTFEEAQEKLMSFRDRIEEGRMALQGFFDAFSGKPEMLEEDWLGSDESYDMYITLYELGMKVRDIVDWFTRLKDTVSGLNLSEKLGGIGEGLGDMPFIQKIGEAFSALGTIFGPVITMLKGTFMPLWEQISTQFTSLILPAWNNLVGAFQRFLPILGVVAAALGAILSAVIQGIARALPGIVTIVTSVITAIINVVAGIIDFVTGLVTIIVGLFTAAIDGGKLLEEGWATLKAGVVGILGGIVQAIVGVLGGAVEIIFGFFAGIIEGTIGFITGLIDYLVGGTSDLGTEVVSAISNWITDALTAISEFIDGIIEFFTNLYNDLIGNSIIPDMLADIITAFITFFADIVLGVAGWIEDVLNSIGGFASDFADAGYDLLVGLADGIADAVSEVIAAVTDVVNDIVDTVTDILDMESPSKVFMDIGLNTGLGFIEGVEGVSEDINAAVADSLVSPALDATTSLGDFQFSASAADGIGTMTPPEYEINLNFGKDSVRSDDDITRIAAEVERILLRKLKLQYGFGTGAR